MRRRALAVIAVVALVLVGGIVTGVPGTISEHDTDSDFQSGDVTFDNMTVSGTGESATIGAEATNFGSSVGPSFGSAGSRTAKTGIIVEPRTDLSGFNVTIGDDGDADTLYLENNATGQTLKTFSSSANEEITVWYDLQAGTEYRLVIANADSSSYTTDITGTSPSFPLSSADVNITAGYDGGYTTSDAYAIANVEAIHGGEESTYQATHDVSNATQATVDVAAIANASVTATWQEPDGSGGWTDLTSQSITSAGETTVSLPANTADQYRVWINASNTESFKTDWTFDVESESLQADRNAPSVTAESPADGANITDSSVKLAANVSDADFDESWGDNVTVRWIANGNEIHNETVSSAGQVSYTWSNYALGENEWYVEVEDDYQLTDTSETRTFSTPSELRIYNETSPSQLVDGSVEVEVTFFGDSGIYNRSTTDGTVNLSGLPSGEDLVVSMNPDSDYHGRTVIIDSIFTQQDVYLLPTTASSVDTTFVLDDPTGQFGPESVLYIEKPITKGGSTSYETIVSDQFGSEGLTVTLEKDVRYNLRIESADGVSQTIGPYRAAQSETVNVRPGSPSIDLGQYQDGWAASADIIQPSEGDYRIEYAYDDPDSLTSSLEVSVVEKGNESNQLGATRSYTDLGSASGQFNLTANESEKTWIVKFDVDRDGESFVVEEQVSKGRDLTGNLSDVWKLVIGVSLLFVSAGIFSVLNATVGGVVVSIEAGVLWWTGWLPGATSGAAIVLALFLAVIVHIYKSSGP